MKKYKLLPIVLCSLSTLSVPALGACAKSSVYHSITIDSSSSTVMTIDVTEVKHNKPLNAKVSWVDDPHYPRCVNIKESYVFMGDEVVKDAINIDGEINIASVTGDIIIKTILGIDERCIAHVTAEENPDDKLGLEFSGLPLWVAKGADYTFNLKWSPGGYAINSLKAYCNNQEISASFSQSTLSGDTATISIPEKQIVDDVKIVPSFSGYVYNKPNFWWLATISPGDIKAIESNDVQLETSADRPFKNVIDFSFNLNDLKNVMGSDWNGKADIRVALLKDKNLALDFTDKISDKGLWYLDNDHPIECEVVSDSNGKYLKLSAPKTENGWDDFVDIWGGIGVNGYAAYSFNTGEQSTKITCYVFQI